MLTNGKLTDADAVLLKGYFDDVFKFLNVLEDMVPAFRKGLSNNKKIQLVGAIHRGRGGLHEAMTIFGWEWDIEDLKGGEKKCQELIT